MAHRQHSPWLVVAASGAGIAFSSGTIAFYVMGLMIDPIRAERGWDTATIVLAATVFALVQVVSVPVAGLVLDRVGVRRLLLPSMLIFAFSVMSLALVETPLQFYIAFGVIGVVGGGLSSLIFVRAICSWFDRRRGIAIGLASSGMGVGLVIVPPLSALILQYGSWRLVYVALGCIVLFITLPIVAGLVHEREDPLPAPASIAKLDAHDRSPLTTGRFWLFIATFFLLSGVVNSVALHLVSLARSEDLTKLALTAASLFGAAMIVGRLVTGVLVDHFEARKVAAVMILLVSAASFIFASGPSPVLLLVCAAMVGLGAGSDGDLMTFMVSRYFALRHFGTVSGYGYGAYILAASLFPYLTGVSVDRLGSYGSACIVGGIMALAAAALVLLLGRTPEQDWPPSLEAGVSA